MKKYLLILLAVPFMSISNPVFAEAKIKEVCRDEVDKKGQKRKVCKKIKVHKKLEGTPVPTKK